MRMFSTQTMWDVKEQQWYNVYTVDQEEVAQEEYFRELETEQCLEADDIDEVDEYCQCCNCPDQCNEFNCTCGEDLEVENGKVDEYLDQEQEDYFECECPDCVEERKVDFLSVAVNIISEGMCCPQCLYELLESVYDKGASDGFDQGYEECKKEIREFLED